MTKELVFGHKVPDTDAIVAAKAYAYLQNKKGYDVEAVALGEMNDETKFVLDYFNEKAPRIVETGSNEVNQVMLVDHNEPQQSISDIDKLEVTHVVDHHRISNFDTSVPLFYLAKPYGCTSTILYEEFNRFGIEIPAELAGMMASAIISDTLLLKSPTTTKYDEDALNELVKISKIDDLQEYGIQMLKAGTNVESKSDSDIILGDAKSFNLGSKKVTIGQVNVVDLTDITKRANDLKVAMKSDNDKNSSDLFLLIATNVLDSDSKLIVVGEPKESVEKAFNKSLDENDMMDLPGVVSRKKQVVPPLTDIMN
ncbi:manganese-dependent inorganic pyrophosphatase [Lactobacillus sp. S2-2]|uniref:manganese-dependent inorganic pyrophosphatase n=1 Tax=Lactobacillus sp. S2-2 TaxID=2692917 RepID=UPI001F0063FB|nr:manganese-dependent inorganic pyrophosphatase [Lactobacillus sp. S2-2]MCF6515039.1 manganese-dependent inorganic pyrophosphatase [Lactobacillus sp. S2-2]